MSGEVQCSEAPRDTLHLIRRVNDGVGRKGLCAPLATPYSPIAARPTLAAATANTSSAGATESATTYVAVVRPGDVTVTVIDVGGVEPAGRIVAE